MNGRGLRLYGLSSFTRPVSYPCHRRSRPLRGGVTRGETGKGGETRSDER